MSDPYKTCTQGIVAIVICTAVAGYSLRPALADNNSDIKSVFDNVRKLSSNDYAPSLDAYSERISKNPNDVAARFGRGYILFLQKKFQRALPDTNCAVSLAPGNAYVFALHGLISLNLPNYKGAIADFDRAIELNPEDDLSYCGRGSAQRHLGDYQAAVADYTKALDLKPGLATAYTGRGNTYRALKDYHRAILDYDASLKISPSEEVDQLRAATIREQQVVNSQKAGQGYSPSPGHVSTTEDYATTAENQYCDHMQKESLQNFAHEFDAAPPDSQEKGYLLMIMAKRLPKESSENVLTTISQLNPVGRPDDDIFWQLVGEAKIRSLDPFAKISSARLAGFVHYFPWQSSGHLIFFTEVVKRLPQLSAGELKAVLGALPLSEVQLRDEVLREIHSRRAN